MPHQSNDWHGRTGNCDHARRAGARIAASLIAHVRHVCRREGRREAVAVLPVLARGQRRICITPPMKNTDARHCRLHKYHTYLRTG